MNDPVMYFVVNTNLNMGKGKIAAQVAHAAVELSDKKSQVYKDWKKHGSTKIVLKAEEKEMVDLADKYKTNTYSVLDYGKTQVEPDSFTVLGFKIAEKNYYPELVHLKLL